MLSYYTLYFARGHISVIDFGKIACSSNIGIDRMVRLLLSNDFLVMK